MNSGDLARWHADVAARRTRYRLVACETCLDLGRVNRIHGGVEFEECCPEEEDPLGEWNNWTELLDDGRRGK